MSWNCRGVGKKCFPSLVRDLSFCFKVSILALLETRVGSPRSDEIIKKLGFPNFFKQDPVGFFGGLWLLWDGNKVELEILKVHHQFIHTRVKYLDAKKVDLVTFVYGSPRRLERKLLWAELEVINNSILEPWLLLGDFNSILHASEKVGGKEVCWDSMKEMQLCLSRCDIHDLGYKGPDFTWKHGRLHERMDRACTNEDWNIAWPDKFTIHLPFFNSDHRPILICDDGQSRPGDYSRRFKFLAAWLTDQRFFDLVKKSWGE
ncbi:uncharacterized protein LOC133296846 [Gastrolobium bilobum]|uniref:uncharacterized protein LOC133296846 n=1 Tax=Gastrolobium bilobum TaxID=150636 RepID=UPI002AB102C3|nr:uncharacterized protein LOC133296846 [Gastrolobium bilobum]